MRYKNQLKTFIIGFILGAFFSSYFRSTFWAISRLLSLVIFVIGLIAILSLFKKTK